MNQRLMLALALALMLFSTAAAQYIIVGPPDDQTFIDTTDQSAWSMKPPPLMTSLGAMTSLPVDTINITQLDCSLFPLICTYVEALDSLGNPIGGLTADSFCVYQNGVLIGPGNFTVQELSVDSCITSICLVVDVSGSMTEGTKFTDTKNAMRRFVRNMDAYDRVAIVSFASSVTTVQTFTSDTTLLLSKINGLVASGNTAAFDGIWQGVNVTVAELGSKAVIAFTDGLENRSHITPQPPNGVGSPATQPYTDDSTLICNFANGASIPVYTFNLGSITNTYYNTEAMEAFANGTGGFWRHAPSGALIDSVYDEIKVRICSRYKICYTSLDTIQDGTIHVTKICHKVGGNCVGCDEASCQEQAPPVIVRTPPTIDLSDTCQVRTNPLQICVKVTDEDTPPASFTVRLFYRLVGSPGYPTYTDVAMTQQGGPNDSIFCYTIPANLLNCRSALEYYITASDGQYTLSNPAVNPQTSPYSVAICPNLPPTVSCIADTSIFVCTLAPICLTGFNADDPDGNLATVTVSTGTILEDEVCFTPVAGANVLQVIATDSCGLADTCVSTVNVTLNSAPIVQCHADTMVAFCAPGQVCVDGFVATDVDNNIVTKTASLGTLTGTTVCFNALTAGVYSITFIATDACGKADTCVTNVTVTFNQAPVADAGRDSTLFQCTPAPICITAACSDPNGNLSTCELVSGPGTYNGSAICFTPAASGTYTLVLKATDACGLTDYDTSVVNVTLNQAPVANAGNDSTLFQCTPAPICITAACSDPNGNLSTCELVSGPGTYNGSQICFTPAASGTYTLVLKATDACGLTDYDTSVVNVTLNQAPVADAGRDSTLFQCTPAPICITAACSDPNGNLSTCQLVSGPGTYNGSQICFTPAASGTYTLVLKATDACGLTDYDTSVVNVTLNQAPVADAGRDSTLFQCTPAPICITAACSDPNGNLSTCELVSGPGTYNGSAICFTPAASGTYTLVLKATDACGLTDFDTSVVNVTLNQAPVANAGNDSTLFQCTPAPICITASCSDPNGNLSTCQLVSGPGTYNGSAICFTPAGAGSFTFVLKATDACGATDYDTSVVTVTLNQPPVATMGNDSTVFQCGAAPICIPASCSDPNGNLSTCQLVSGPGSYNGSNVCFTPAGAGVYTFVLQATDACGATDFDTAVVTVAVNLPPVANAGRDSTLFQCAPAQICIAAGCSDPDANLTNCELTSGPGTLNGGGICFTPASSGVYTFIVKATDACGLTDYDTSVVNVTINQAPVATVGNDSTLFQCAPAPICVTASCSDPNGNLSTCELVSGPGTYNGSAICFTPAASGSYTLVLKATDACGLTDYDTSVVNVTLNQAPLANAGRDSTLFQCAPAPICITAGCSDPNSNLTSCNLISGPGTYNGSQICFTPAGAGTFTFVLQATDACGATDLDTSVVTVSSNTAPVVTCPGNQVMFVCNLNQICVAGFSATDAENNITSYQVTGGTIQGNQLCFTPVAGPNMIRVIAIDACGVADTCITTVTVTLNTPPVANAGADQNLNCRTSGDPICWNVSCTDVDAGTPNCELVSPVGTLTGNQICFSPTASGAYSFVLKATDGCGAIDFDTAVVNVRLNVGPELTIVSGDTTFACLDVPSVPWCVPFSYSDADNNVSGVTVSGLPGAVLNYANGNGTVCFTPPLVTAQYEFTLTVTDSCGLTAQQQHQQLVAMIDCDTATCFVMQIEKTHNSLQGQYEFVSIFTQSDALEMGGFDLLIKYDNSGLSFVEAQPGQLLISCGWEYFTYRYGAIGNCNGPCPSGLVRIIAVADANNGPNHPSCFGAPDGGQYEVARLKFLVTNDRTFECQYLPVTFYWIDCGDNAVSTVSGDTLYLDKRIYSFEGELLWDELDNVLYPDANRPLGLGAKDYCLLGDKYHPIRCIEFIEGGVDVICADSIDAPGDLNLNGIAYEIADAVLYTNYFLYGIAALDPDPMRREAQIAASDVNQDGTVLSVGDLVYLLRVIMGDALPFPKLAPFANTASVKWQNGELSISSSTDVGALRAKFRVSGSYQVAGMNGMEMLTNDDNGEFSVLIYSGLDDMSRRIVAGTSQILRIEGDAELLDIEAADFEGNMLNLSVSKSSLPTEFALGQNRPNPFNPNTQIELELPVASDWKIEIFNITGQLVKTLSGSGVGRVVAEWDGSGAPSGVYFYRASAGAFSETRKMLLLK